MAVPYSFGSATSAIPLSQLDSNFATTITLGNTAIQLGNTVTTLNNMTLANVTISSGSVTLTSASVTNANVTSTLTLDGGTANGVAYLNTSKVVTTGSALTFDGTNLGIGAAPNAWATLKALQVLGAGFSGTANNAYVSANTFYNGSVFKYINSDYATYYTQQGGKHQWHYASSGSSGADVNFIQGMTFDGSGNLLVGTTSTSTTNGGFVAGGGANTYCEAGHASGSSSGNYYSIFKYAGNIIGSITQNGTTAVLYNLMSDQRLKTNIQDADDAATLIDAIQVRQYDWKSDGSHQRYGFIAQELVTVAPEAVHQPVDPDEMMAVDYSKLVPMLVKEIQSLRKRLATLESK
jgi:hypothetical protein